MYTYGKEGMSIPIAIFKDQKDPVIGPEWTYPGIYENKVAMRDVSLHELFEMEASEKGFDSPWQRKELDNRVRKSLDSVATRMMLANMKMNKVMQKERAGRKEKADAAPAAGKSAAPGTTPPATGKVAAAAAAPAAGKAGAPPPGKTPAPATAPKDPAKGAKK